MDNESTGRWANGIPSAEELSPLNTNLITPMLACAFNLEPDAEAQLTEAEVEEAALRTVRGTERLREQPQAAPPEENHGGLMQAEYSGMGWQGGGGGAMGRIPEEEAPGTLATLQGVHGNMPTYGAFSGGKENSMDSGGGKKARPRGGESLDGGEDELDGLEHTSDEPPGRALKRPRLVWTPQLHKRFCDAVNHLGVENAVPKTIMQLMNVEGLTRENVASHLQKYRLYLRQRFQNDSSAAPSTSDPAFAMGPQPSRAGPSEEPSMGGSREADLPQERIAHIGHGVGTMDGGPTQQDVGYRDYGGYPVGMQLTGKPGQEIHEVGDFGRPLKRSKFIDERALAAHGHLQ